MTAAIGATVAIALSKLDIDPKNVRKTYDAKTVADLAANIEEKGLIQNLVVRAGDKKGRFYVTAGGRRFRALTLLVEQGKLPKTHEVSCQIREADEALEISLSENIMREQMLGSVLQLSCWVRTAVTVLGDIHGAYRGRQADVRVKRSRSEARTTLEAAATRQACP